jgi:hypothetical protein
MNVADQCPQRYRAFKSVWGRRIYKKAQLQAMCLACESGASFDVLFICLPDCARSSHLTCSPRNLTVI